MSGNAKRGSPVVITELGTMHAVVCDLQAPLCARVVCSEDKASEL
jgi:hypothetical protein